MGIANHKPEPPCLHQVRIVDGHWCGWVGSVITTDPPWAKVRLIDETVIWCAEAILRPIPPTESPAIEP